jgi:hypothetical protein
MEPIKTRKPTDSWRQQLNEGSEFFTDEAIKESDILLDKYISTLQVTKDEATIWRAIEKVVTGFNRLNIEHHDFIETVEREELAEYIQGAAEAAGLSYDGDVTEEWREEW